MKLPSQSKYLSGQSKNQQGQILIVFLLVLVVGLAIALSIASRTVTDIRQTTTSDDSNRAYFAAEAGIERALKEISENAIPSTSLNFTDVNKSEADVSVSNLVGGTFFEVPGKVQKDDVVQVYLMSDYTNVGTAGVGASILKTDTLTFYWDQAGSSAPAPAIEVSILQCGADATACTETGAFDIKKMTFDPLARSNFCGSVGTPSGAAAAYKYQAVVTLNSNTGCANNDLISSGRPVLARIRFLYNSAGAVPLAIGGSRALPNQGWVIESVGTTPSKVTRKLKVTKLYPALPAIFDYVLYNGSTNALTKN